MIYIKLFRYGSGRCKAMFDTRNESDGPDNGCRVKHYIFRDENPNAFWHISVWLTRWMEPMDTPHLYVSDRLFWGKVRLVVKTEIHLADTWKATSDIVNRIEEIESTLYTYEK